MGKHKKKGGPPSAKETLDLDGERPAAPKDTLEMSVADLAALAERMAKESDEGSLADALDSDEPSSDAG